MKRIIILFMVISMLVSTAGAVESPMLNIKNQSSDAKLNLVNQRPDPAEPGSYVEVRWEIENVGESSAKDVRFKIEPKYPFSLAKDQDPLQELGKMESYQVDEDAYTIYYKLRVDEDAVEGPNEIDLKYSADKGKSWTIIPYDIRVEERNFLLSIDNIKTENVEPGKDTKVSFEIKNLASSYIKDINTELVLDELPFSPKGSDEKVFETIKGKEKKEAEFELSVDAGAAEKVHKVPVKITYYDHQGTEYEKEFTIGIKVFEEPEYIINLEDTNIYSNNQKGEFTASISNIGSGEMKYLTAELLESQDYKIVSSDTIYLGNLESDDFETANFDIYTESDKDNIPLKLKLNYKDSYNKEYEDTKTLDLKLYNEEQAARFGFTDDSGKSNIIYTIIIGAVLLIFWLFMLIDAIKSDQEGYKKGLWIALMVLTFAVGSLLYYMIGRKKKLG